MQRALGDADLELFRKDFLSHPTYRLVQNAITKVGLDGAATDRGIVNETGHALSVSLDDWKVTDQKHSGRCWLFAGLNLLRVGAMRKMGLKEFELSQNYVTFWDKLERANYFLEAVIETADRDVDDRTVATLLDVVADDGGQWDMFVAIVLKHGLVPKTFMPETQSSSSTDRMNWVLRYVLRQGAKTLRDSARSSVENARAEKADVLAVVHRVLCMHLGTPPAEIDWQWIDSDRNFHRDGPMTPQDFARRYVELPLDEYVCLVHDPRPTSPVGRTFTVEHLGNVVGASPVVYLNVEMPVMKELAARVLQSGEPVWFGCDVDKMMSSDFGIWDAALFDFPALYDARFDLEKADRLLYHESRMDHAMLFTGVDLVDGRPRRWRVENSWGKDKGKDGFYTMNDSWFDEYVFEVAVRKSLLTDDQRAALEQEPIVLPAWDPMGALAR
ncbi:MAG: C1 family peptidase [Actinomycetota bacterium]|jgi:bleomycin hydrolase|nr:C1 family peptidase [Actinomycetota bacterium]